MKACCLNCVMKHLSQAMVIHEEEVPLGYPDHIYRVIGHMAEASRECVALYPELAGVIRDHRLAIMDSCKHIPPYADLLAYVAVLVGTEAAGLPPPGVPEPLMVTPPPADI